MIIERYTYGNFEGSKYIIATTDLTEYFPAYITFETQRKRDYRYDTDINNRLVENIGNNVYLYRKPERLSSSSAYTVKDKYDNLFDALENRLSSIRYVFTYNDHLYKLNVIKGYIADENDNILLLLTTNTFKIFDINKNIKKDVLRLYLSTQFIKNEIYKNLYKRLERDYISKFYEEDIEVVFTTSKKIEENIFKNNFNLEYNNLTELSSILQELPHQNLNYSFGNSDETDVPFNYEVEEEDYEDLPF